MSADEQILASELALEMMHEIRNTLEVLSRLNLLTLQDADDPPEILKYLSWRKTGHHPGPYC